MDGITALAALWTAGWLGARSVAGGAAASSGAAGSVMASGATAWGGLRTIVTGATGAVGSGTDTASSAAGRRYPAGTFGAGAAASPRSGGGWDRPMTEAQRGQLDRLAAGRGYPADLTRGQASRLIQRWGGEESWYRGGAGSKPDAPDKGDGQ